MTYEQMIHEAVEHGNSIGQVALAQYILKAYSDQVTPDLRRFLEKISENNYETIGNNVGQPSEDVALGVDKIMEGVS